MSKEEDAQRASQELQEALRAGYEPPFPAGTYDWFLDYSQPQTMMFYIDLIPYLHHLLAKLPFGVTLKFLDAGCGSGAGAELLGSLHRTVMLQHKYDVTGIDLFDTYQRYAQIAYHNMRYEVGDVFALPDQSYDVVICSHVIEHFHDPTAFMKKLQSISRYFALFYCPLNEEHLLDEGRGHLRSISEAFVEGFDPVFVETRESLGWRHPDDERSSCVVFALPGAQWSDLGREKSISWLGARPLPLELNKARKPINVIPSPEIVPEVAPGDSQEGAEAPVSTDQAAAE